MLNLGTTRNLRDGDGLNSSRHGPNDFECVGGSVVILARCPRKRGRGVEEDKFVDVGGIVLIEALVGGQQNAG